VEKLMPFLTGKAHDFYIRSVSHAPRKWRINAFFRALFNDCFPPNFLSIQCARWERCTQGNKTVRDFVYDIEEFENLLGDITPWQKVVRFWNGLSEGIQRELWLDKLSPEYSLFDEVKESAEAAERALEAVRSVRQNKPSDSEQD
jgi:polyphosphate kinase 2 (PPK2 family)